MILTDSVSGSAVSIAIEAHVSVAVMVGQIQASAN
jgi:hypothetical protein